MTLPTNFCIAPFLQHTTHPSGSYSPCPYLGGTSWKGRKESILEQWSSTELEQLRQDFRDNKKSSVCNRCWHEEQNGLKSLRKRLYDVETGTSDYSFATPEAVEQRLADYSAGPLVLTIKNGNLCNAKCRVCHPGDSSRWIEDSVKLHQLTGKQYYSLEQQERNWSDQQLEEILQLSQNLVRLELFGGEPTYNKQVARLLTQLAECGLSKNIVVYINTNGGMFIPDRFPELKQFKGVELGISVDGVGRHFNYIRHGIDYDYMVHNVKRMQEYFEQQSIPYFIDAISTVNILNVLYLPEIKAAVTEFLPLEPFWNLLVNPEHLFIKNMPDQIKQAVIAKLQSDSSFEQIINVIQQPADADKWNEFVEITGALDQIRNEDFATTFPELHALIQTLP